MHINSFQECHSLASLMNNYDKPWCIAGGWAIDLFLGHVTRKHADIEIIILREDQADLQHYLSGYSFQKVRNGQIEPWLINEKLELPIHEAYAANANAKLEILLNDSVADEWVYRRDGRVKRPLSEIIYFYNGIPYLNPALVLLYKSKEPRAKDEQDFQTVYMHLEKQDKLWLKDAIKICYSEHRWLHSL
nr:hypothetical protein [Paenibacillus sp. MMS18-CY102]